jgi:hypothetical protein
MKCENVEAVIIDYLEKTIDEGLRQEIEKHLETCERCLDSVRETQQVMHLISEDEMVKPDDSLRINFYHMLHNEIKKVESKSDMTFQKTSGPWYISNRMRVAAGFALLICGTLFGLLIGSEINKSGTAKEMKLLHAEVTSLKRTAMFSMLDDESSSYRIQAVSYADDINNPDAKVIEVLVKTLNQDKNVNVRMAAAYALAKYADQKAVCDSLVQSLSHQVDPILQVTLINILVEKKEKSALKPIQQIINNRSTLKEVKAVAQNGLRVLI